MGTVVLPSQDCLHGRLHLDASRPSPATAPAPAPPPKKSGRRTPHRSTGTPDRPKTRPCRRVSFSDDDKPSPTNHNAAKPPPPPPPSSRDPVMGEVRILKRGESLKAGSPPPPPRRSETVDRRSDAVIPSSSSLPDRLGPSPDMLPKQIRVDRMPEYAGPATLTSPAPSALPFPALFVKKADAAADLATRGLRCLLRIETPLTSLP